MVRVALLAVGFSGCGYGVPTSDTGNDDDGQHVIPLPTDTDETGTGGPLQIEDDDVFIHETIESILVVEWTQNAPAEAHLEFTFENDEWHSSPVKSYDAGTHQELMLGLPYDSLVTWRLVLEDGELLVKTDDDLEENGSYPYDAPGHVLHTADATKYDAQNAPYFLVGLPAGGQSWAGAPWWALIVDRQGRPVWALESPFNRSFMHARVARDGKSLLLDHNSYWPTFDGGDGSLIEKTAIDGTVLHTFITEGMHHPFTDLPDGSIAYGAEQFDGEHILIAHEDGEIEDVFNCQEWIAAVDAYGYCASNTLSYDESTNMFLFSHYPFSTILEVDRDTGDVDRWWGNANSTWSFNPPDSKFTWQHGGHMTAAGTLLTSTLTISGAQEIVAREYSIDDDNETLHQIKSWGIGEGLFGDVMGEAYFLPNGDLIHNTGGLARIREYTADGEVVWDLEWSNNDAIGRSMPIVDLYALEAP